MTQESISAVRELNWFAQDLKKIVLKILHRNLASLWRKRKKKNKAIEIFFRQRDLDVPTLSEAEQICTKKIYCVIVLKETDIIVLYL